MTEQLIGRMAVIGVGLIGGSLARALREADAVGEVVGCGRDAAHLERARVLGVIDRFKLDPARAVAGADMVAVCTPVGAVGTMLAAIQSGLGADTVVTDAGSVKGEVVRAAGAAVPRACESFLGNFVPGHPIAGTEYSGVEASFSDLYRGRQVILTPTADTRKEAIARVRRMWEVAGATVTEMDAAHHDRMLAATSHLPHVLAYALVDLLAAMEDSEEVFAYTGGGFRDVSRIASSAPNMWVDIVRANRPELVRFWMIT
jgi:prephenate dehydrogenase